jgi:ubiquinone/menaquinone biosynthesis C-methylase UbiE
MINNKATYTSEDVVRHYEQVAGLEGPEQYLFERYVKKGQSILDVGVGGGRTTPALSQHAKRYVGVDYVQEMVDACTRRFPGVRFEQGDASALTNFKDAEFDVVVFSFNGIDSLSPDEKRLQALAEFRRVLKKNGVLIFSSHNAQSLFVVPKYTDASLKQKLWRSVRSVGKTAQLMRRSLSSRAFWNGAGYVAEPTHGGLFNHSATPQAVINETTGAGYKLLEVLNGRFPESLPPFATPWYYYAFERN